MYIDVFQHHRAIEKFPDWVINDCRKSHPDSFRKFVNSVVADSNIVYSNLDYFKKYENARVLFVAGGPSSKEIEWTADGYDTAASKFTISGSHINLMITVGIFVCTLAFIARSALAPEC